MLSYISSRAGKVIRTVGLMLVVPAFIVCSGSESTGTVETPDPGTVSDLSAAAPTNSSVNLSFTQVDDGTGAPAKYDVRYGVAPMSWGSATSVATGSCATPMMGNGVGSTMSCVVQGLSPSTSYNFQLVAFRGSLNGAAVFGGVSNMVAASTTGSPPPPPVVTTVTVSPPSASIGVSGTTTLQATVKDQNGNVMTGQTVSWSTDNSAVATVTSAGVVTGVAAGSATITATSSGQSGTSAITVTAAPPPPPVVTTVTVAPPSASIAVGANTTLTATVKDQNGNVMTGQTVTWSTNNAAAATVSSGGVVSGVAAGSATITATSSGKSGTSSITVTAPTPVVTTVTVAPPSASIAVGATTTLTATVKDQNGNVMSGQTVTWSTNNAAAATVSSGGVVSGVAAGSATITATSSGKSGTSAITVTSGQGGSGTILFQEDFEGSGFSAGWYDNQTVVMSTAEHAANSTASAQYRFTAGATMPTSGASSRHKFTPSSSVYIRYDVKFTSNWVGSGLAYHPHEIYVMSDMDADYDGPSNAWMTLYLEHTYQNGGKPRLMMQDNKAVNSSMGTPPINLVGVTENRSTGGCNGMAETNMNSECFMQGYWFNDKSIIGPVVMQPNPGTGYKGNWNRVEAYFQLNTVVGGIGQADGVMQYWFNGTLIIDRHDILYRTGARPNLKLNKFLIAPYIGDGSPVDQSMFIDNLVVATGKVP